MLPVSPRSADSLLSVHTVAVQKDLPHVLYTLPSFTLAIFGSVGSEDQVGAHVSRI